MEIRGYSIVDVSFYVAKRNLSQLRALSRMKTIEFHRLISNLMVQITCVLNLGKNLIRNTFIQVAISM